MGWYCAYCEVALPTGPHVEHKLPKRHHDHLRFEWSNWLLACTNCNSTKGERDVALEAALWPDRDNTALAFSYESGLVSLRSELRSDVCALAVTTRDLVGLDRRPGHPRLTPTDRRWSHRLEAHDKAVHARVLIAGTTADLDRLQDLAVEIALATGFFSVWMAVFEDDVAMRRRLVQSFRVAPGCFDGGAVALARQGGAC